MFIGPTTDNIRTFGLKHSARALAAAHGVPLAPGTDLLTDEEQAAAVQLAGLPAARRDKVIDAAERIARHPQ